MVKRERHTLICNLLAIGPHAVHFAFLWILERKTHIVRDNEIEATVPIIVEPSRACRPSTRVFHPCSVRHFCECSITIVMKQRARGITGHVQIRKAVVIEIADRNSHSIKSQTTYPGLRRHILKLSIPEVVIERIANGNWALAMRRLATVHEEDVL